MEDGLDIMVLQEEEAKCSNSNKAGGKKKNKHKIPQRGLGVAQLEKLRMEEQRRSAASSSSNASQGTSLFPFRQPILPFLTATNDPSPMLKPVDNRDSFFRYSEAFSTQSNYVDSTPPRAFDNSIVCSANPMLWNTMEPSPLNGEELARNFGHLYGGDSLIPGWRPFGLLQRRQQQLLSPTSVLNKALPSSPSGINLQTSSGTSLQMEPPSNQSYTSKHTVSTLWPEEDKNLV